MIPVQFSKKTRALLLMFNLSLTGIFPQDEYPEEVSTDEDDDMFGSRKRMKRRGHMAEDDAPESKKTKRMSDYFTSCLFDILNSVLQNFQLQNNSSNCVRELVQNSGVCL